ncbi:MAG: hypothetical protein IJ853_03000 [Rickettsiales bacterium]|nr:hypothetical protein [Rickettsiales bacterium]
MKKVIAFITCVLLCSCAASGSYIKLKEELRNDLKAGNKEKAVLTVNNKDYYSGKNSILVKKMEQGTANYIAGNYYQSLKYLDEAEKIAEELYTVKISSKLKGAVNGNLDDYRGEKFEVSLIYFYKSLVNYNLYLCGKYEKYITKDKKGKDEEHPEKILTENEKLEHLRKARSNIMKWDSILNSYNLESKSKEDYGLDLLEKVWGAFIFEENAGMSDMERAKAMYNSANKILNSNYSNYQTFNKDRTGVTFSADTDDFINRKISKSTNYAQKDNVVVLLNEGFVPFKKTKTIMVPMGLVFLKDTSVDFMRFMTGVVAAKSATGEFLFKIQLPELEQYSINSNFVASIHNKNNEKIKDVKINILEPVSDLSYTAFEKNKAALYAKITASTLTQYALALETSYAMYKASIQNNMNEAVAMLLSVGSYVSATKLIEKNGIPDLRQWSTLPSTIRFTTFDLPCGEYILKINKVVNGENKEVYSKEISIEDTDTTTFVDVNINQ